MADGAVGLPAEGVAAGKLQVNTRQYHDLGASCLLGLPVAVSRAGIDRPAQGAHSSLLDTLMRHFLRHRVALPALMALSLLVACGGIASDFHANTEHGRLQVTVDRAVNATQESVTEMKVKPWARRTCRESAARNAKCSVTQDLYSPSKAPLKSLPRLLYDQGCKWLCMSGIRMARRLVWVAKRRIAIKRFATTGRPRISPIAVIQHAGEIVFILKRRKNA